MLLILLVLKLDVVQIFLRLGEVCLVLVDVLLNEVVLGFLSLELRLLLRQLLLGTRQLKAKLGIL